MVADRKDLDFARHMDSLSTVFSIKQFTGIGLMTVQPILNSKSFSDIINCLV